LGCINTEGRFVPTATRVEHFDGIYFLIMAKKAKSNWEISCFGWDGISGVYCVCHNYLGVRQIIYVGQSANIGKRVLAVNHPYIKSYQKGLPVYILYRECAEKNTRIELERRLIKRLKPILNIQYNG